RLGPAAGPFMQALSQPRQWPLAMSLAATLTTLSGVLLFWRLAGGHLHAFMHTPFGMTLSLGALAALVAFTVGLSVNKPAATRSAKLMATIAAQGRPADAEQLAQLATLRQRLRVGGNTIGILLAAAVLLMGIARYM